MAIVKIILTDTKDGSVDITIEDKNNGVTPARLWAKYMITAIKECKEALYEETTSSTL